MASIAECRISVVIPVHNKGPHVLDTIQSVLHQSVPPHEIIVVDDASTDDGIDQISQLKHPNIRILHRSMPGPGGYAARNLAIQQSTGDWIAFLDADDMWKPNHLEMISGEASKAPAAVGCIFCGFEFLEKSGSIRRDVYSTKHLMRAPTRISFAHFLDEWLANGVCPIWTGSSVFRRSTLFAAGFFPAERCRRGGDKDLWLRAMATADAISISTVTSVYNRRATNMVTDNETMHVCPCVCQSIMSLVKEGHDESWRLKQVYNRETYVYALCSWRQGSAKRVVFQGFFISTNPIAFCYLLAMWLLPGRSIPMVRQLVRNLRFFFRQQFSGRRQS